MKGPSNIGTSLQKKVGLITLFGNNYGSILQAYATKTFVESLGVRCDLFQIVPSRCMLSKIWRKICVLKKMLMHPSFYRLYSKQKEGWKVDGKNLVCTTENMMKEFVAKELRPQKISANNLYNPLLQNDYDYFITGSDQVWNARLFVDPANFLRFTLPKKKIALAVSYGITEIPKYNQQDLRDALGAFNFISVREETGVQITKKYSTTRVCRIADPTLIFSDEEWRKMTKEEKPPSFKYILVHFLNKPSPLAVESIDFLAQKFNLQVVIVGYNYETFNRMNNVHFLNGGPLRYVSLIDHSENVVTDSFHTTLFSINLKKSFFVFQRQYSTLNEGCRITDLLERFDLKKRFITEMRDVKECISDVPSDCKAFLFRERAVIRDYIEKSISGEIPQVFL